MVGRHEKQHRTASGDVKKKERIHEGTRRGEKIGMYRCEGMRTGIGIRALGKQRDAKERRGKITGHRTHEVVGIMIQRPLASDPSPGNPFPQKRRRPRGSVTQRPGLAKPRALQQPRKLADKEKRTHRKTKSKPKSKRFARNASTPKFFLPSDTNFS